MAKDIKVKIILDGVSAVLNKLGRLRRGFSRTFSRIRAVVGSVRSVLGVFVRATRNALIGLAAFTGASAHAAGRLEMLRLRLKTVSSSAEEAERTFKRVFAISVRTQFTPEQLVDAMILLRSVGQGTEEALLGAASAAAGMGRDIQDVVMAVASIETEPLRRLGIELSRTGDTATLVFRDKMGKEINRTVKGIGNIRSAIIDAFETKFGGGLEEASQTLEGLVSTLRGNLQVAFAAVGDRILPSLKNAIRDLNDALTKMSAAGGVLSRVGDKLRGVIDRIVGVASGASGGDFSGLRQLVADWANLLLNALVEGGIFIAKQIKEAIKEAKLSPKPQHVGGGPFPFMTYSSNPSGRATEPKDPFERTRRALDRLIGPSKPLDTTAPGTSINTMSDFIAATRRFRGAGAGVAAKSGMFTGNEVGLSIGDIATRTQLARAGVGSLGKPDGTRNNPIHVNVTNTDDINQFQ